ncbi:MAG TPA: hypothetical protein VFX58_05660 [Chitinophagaceae bacterium]|nr:hypothetical protein [Chitinophagaceae bacterium]
MNRKRIVLSVLLLAIISGGWYGYSEYTRKVKNLARVKAEISLTATELVMAFEKDETAANQKFLDKILAVEGTLKSVEQNDAGFYTLVLGEPSSMSSVRCSMDAKPHGEIGTLSEGRQVSIKGACTGFTADELLGSDVVLNRCVFDN